MPSSLQWVLVQRREDQPHSTQVFQHIKFSVKELVELVARNVGEPLMQLLLIGNVKANLIKLLETDDNYAPYRGLLDRTLFGFYDEILTSLDDEGECARV